jgi:excisionase family DNA binding protein
MLSRKEYIVMVASKKYLLASEVAKILRTNPQQIYEWARTGVIPPNCVLRLGRKVLFDRDALAEWAATGGVKK